MRTGKAMQVTMPAPNRFLASVFENLLFDVIVVAILTKAYRGVTKFAPRGRVDRGVA
jgi:hypothetical protein